MCPRRICRPKKSTVIYSMHIRFPSTLQKSVPLTTQFQTAFFPAIPHLHLRTPQQIRRRRGGELPPRAPCCPPRKRKVSDSPTTKTTTKDAMATPRSQMLHCSRSSALVLYVTHGTGVNAAYLTAYLKLIILTLIYPKEG